MEILTLVLLFSGVVLTGEEGLMILSGEVHVVVRQRLFVGGVCETLVLGAPEKVHRVPPHFTL